MSDDVQPIRVLIVDDHPVVRHGLRSLLAGHHDLDVVGEAGNGAEALSWLGSHAADVVLLDIQMQGLGGLEVARRAHRSYPAVKIIILTTYDDDSHLHAALAAGVSGFLLKSASHESLPDSIRAVMRGEKLLSSAMVSTVVDGYQQLAEEQAKREAGLTPEDLEVLAAIAEGAGNKDVAERFFWSEATAKRRVQETIGKLGVSSRAQAIAEAARRGWI